MNEYNIKKNKMLGMPHGTANNKLRKLIMFDLVKQLGKDMCYRCKLKIENAEEISIEHKEAWQQSENPKASFFDLNNISFSHLTCNIAAAHKPTKVYADHKEYKRENFKRFYNKNKENYNKIRNERRRKIKVYDGVIFSPEAEYPDQNNN